ncbi:GDP-mannose-dependent alpha-(1-6)-phosphatidylinositol monomannoside mannosyltransferase [Gemmata obscuriglobus]|uniref:Glycosyltransferase n=1 Tax=Gemmata obscuriglobus TaxID=114 RepID=A0A2Z3GZB4_9BACT|nr:glycosyltransferase [Gemmata obscuriglobus]AWM39103.1 hypothetical protein C1280_20360 [Gemmata obscuriglobus]QEG27857.1 GDP-mannose-dependent alpha-(1-6)-phosphatidylinositol monomannoside mannosyltransferase [Gemmata obscuriglobus]VTS05240.1 glycosyl transferase group 1 : Glycosyl transferase OS=Singulisphaera acidiphila (strain ATCC BAA-1392 / DSM 18658 / VKM B-2454 / MOB10) GN=Sinac_0358 PE=4 SV=1: Glyco_trans_1_2: Glyco_transf_4: Glycos_transf_1: Glycos_transf_2: TPR_2 [Gemmata obscurigl
MARFLFGPSDDPIFFDRYLHTPVGSGAWAVFSARAANWNEVEARAGQLPEAVLVWPERASVPAWVWAAPVPVVVLARDTRLFWSGLRHLLPLADLVLTDAHSADRLRRAGIGPVRAANLFGLDRHFRAEIEAPEAERDIDVLIVGRRESAARDAWPPDFGRLATLGERVRVQVTAAEPGAEYRARLRRSKLVVVSEVLGSYDPRALEAAAAGAVVLQRARGDHARSSLEPETECVTYTEADLEAVVGRLLTDEGGRRTIAAAARDRVRPLAFDALVEAAVAAGAAGWDEVRDRAARRFRSATQLSLSGRVWQQAASDGPDSDPVLEADLTAAADHHALGVLARPDAGAELHLAVAAGTGNRVSAVGRALALVALGRAEEAVNVARAAVDELKARPALTVAEADCVPYSGPFDWVRVGWNRAGYDHPDDAEAERQEKARLLRGRALELIAELTSGVSDHEAAAACCPEQPHLQAALGLALLRTGRAADAVERLRVAVEADPFDAASATHLVEALAVLGRTAEAACVRHGQALLANATGLTGEPLVPLETSRPAAEQLHPPPAPAPLEGGRSPFVRLTADTFTARFGSVEVAEPPGALVPPADVRVVLALVAHFAPRRVLAIGTAAGRLSADVTAIAPPDAAVYVLGAPAGDPLGPVARARNRIGTAQGMRFVGATNDHFEVGNLAPLDLAIVGTGSTPTPGRSHAVGAYNALRPGGCLIWPDPPELFDGEWAAWAGGFPEPVYGVTGTRVAFLIKGEGVGATAGTDSGRVAVAWDGELDAVHSLARVNRAVCAELVARGHAVGLARPLGGTAVPLPPELAALAQRAPNRAVHVRHRWPPDFSAPVGSEPLVLMQPWEFGRLPRAWVRPIVEGVDEVWAYSRAVLRAFVASGVPEERVALVPPGVDPERFRPGLAPLSLRTAKRVKLLFVGGTIPRKGFDALLAAYQRAFTAADDVCLVVKEMGAGTFYRGQTAEALVRAAQATPGGPEVLYLTGELADVDVPRLFAACDVLTHPYRGEGFGLPVLEAMACGLPVVVTAGGPTDEFVPPAAGWRVPARVRYFEREEVGGWPTAGFPWWLEPDPGALVAVLREAVSDAAARAARGAAGRRAALGWSWARTAAAVEDRVRVLGARTPVRFRNPVPSPGANPPRAEPPAAVPAVPAVAGRPRVSLTMIVRNEAHNLGACLEGVRDLVDEAVVIDTGSADRTVEVAKSFGCVIGTFPWADSFAAARNAALDAATGDYAFWMDADDRLDGAGREKLRALLQQLPAGNAAFVLRCLCVPDGLGSGGTAVDHVRLFRRHPAHRWTYRVHEQILPALRATGADVRWADVTVRHVGYVDPAVRRRKLDRDLRLLGLDEAERPGDPFTLFNLGCVLHERGDVVAAARALERSLAASHPRDSIVRKAFALLARCRRASGDRAGAVAACRRGREHYPADAELLFLAAGYAREAGNPGGAEHLYRELIGGSEGPHFASVDTGLRTVHGRHNLAVLLLEHGRAGEAEELWRAALAQDPQFAPALLGLGETAIKAGDGAAVARQAAALRSLGPAGAAEGAVLEARWKTARGDHAGAAAVLEAAVAEQPGARGPRVALVHARVAAGAAPAALEAALRGVLVVDPNNAEARRNLEALLSHGSASGPESNPAGLD